MADIKELVPHPQSDRVAKQLMDVCPAAFTPDMLEGTLPYQQVIEFLLKMEGLKSGNTEDFIEKGYSLKHFFGQYQVSKYPIRTATIDTDKSLAAKIKNLKAKGVKDDVLKEFEELANPRRGCTFKGLRVDDAGIHFCLDKTNIYKPFRQHLTFSLDTTGKLTWKYQFYLYKPESLYFQIPRDTLYVYSPEFKDQGRIQTEVILSGSLLNNELVFDEAKFCTTNPNYRAEITDRSTVRFIQEVRQSDAYPSTDYEVSSVSVASMFEYIRQPEVNIDTNPLFPVEIDYTRLPPAYA